MARKKRHTFGGGGGGRPHERGNTAGAAQRGDDGDAKRWGGRFDKRTNVLVEDYTSSIQQDELLLPYDIAGSIAHAQMLGRQGIISPRDAQRIVDGLIQIGNDAAAGKFQLKPELEDVHMNVEAELERRIGPVA